MHRETRNMSTISGFIGEVFGFTKACQESPLYSKAKGVLEFFFLFENV